MLNGAPEIHGVPKDDRRGDEIEPRGAVTLVFERAIDDPALFMEEHGLGERVARFTLVQAGMTSPAQFGALQPVEHKQCALEPTQFGKREVEPVLSGETQQAFSR